MHDNPNNEARIEVVFLFLPLLYILDLFRPIAKLQP